MKFALAWFAVAASVSLAQAQNLPEEAWHAWLAGESQDPASVAPLLANLRAAERMRDAARDSEQYAYVQSLFDALIRLPGPVAADAILPFAKSYRAEVLVLLTRATDAVDALLAMREQTMTDPEWAAVNDLLFRASSPAFFQKTLEELRVSHDFVVTDQDVAYCGGSVGCGLSVRKMPKGFPPIALYQLNTTQGPGDTVLIDKPVPIYLHRAEAHSDGEAQWTDCQFHSASTDPRQSMRARMLGAIAGLSSEQAYELFNPRTTIRRPDAAGAALEMERLLGLQASSIQALIEDAQSRGLVRASGMRIPIKASVQDVRRSRDTAVTQPTGPDILIPLP